MEARRISACAFAICALAACSPKPKADTSVLHHAATKLRVLLDQGFEPDSLAPAVTDLHVELEVVKSSMPPEVTGTCERAASMGDSLRRIIPVISGGDASQLGSIKPDLQNLGLFKTQRDWAELQGHVGYTIPTGLDTSVMTAERGKLLESLMSDIFRDARNAALKATKDCEKAI